MLLLLSCAMGVACASAPDPRAGVIDDRVYRNPYFGLALPIPDEWSVAPRETVESLRDVGESMFAGHPQLQAAARAGRADSAVLLMLSRHPIGAPVETNPIVTLSTGDLSGVPGVRTGADYLFHVSRAMELSGLALEALGGYSLELGGRTFFRRDFRLERGMQTWIVTVAAKQALVFMLVARDEQEIEPLVSLISGISFSDR